MEPKYPEGDESGANEPVPLGVMLTKGAVNDNLPSAARALALHEFKMASHVKTRRHRSRVMNLEANAIPTVFNWIDGESATTRQRMKRVQEHHNRHLHLEQHVLQSESLLMIHDELNVASVEAVLAAEDVTHSLGVQTENPCMWHEINIWPKREIVDYHSPFDFKHQFPRTRVMFDGTECPIKKPKAAAVQWVTFSSYKNRNTAKVLVGVNRWQVSYVSPAYGGSTSNRQIVERSDLTRICNPTDSIMADKGFLLNRPSPIFCHGMISKLQRVQNTAHIVTRTARHNHITPGLKKPHWLPVKDCAQFELLVNTDKALHDQSPVYLRDMLQMFTPGRTLRSRDTQLLIVPKMRTKTYGNRCLTYAAPSLWNGLPILENLRQQRLSKNL
ncbi:hypothetical protein LSH36_693g02090 [Paralvinella palmiformis]|uniref:DDE Tnp4 domain-containing protein n=1 Tax=Paralvinella palmiformis TaxID=53620 RepID=A0AAD9MW61_9ANNE|nr:hypothetical protein LSH36_693g02090 [Paralvinella palmiformis]